jgi:hypothetical protein
MSMPTDEEFKFHIGDKVILDGCSIWTVIDHHRRFHFAELPVQYFYATVQYLYTLQIFIGPHESLILRDVNEYDLELASDSFSSFNTCAENENRTINFKNGHYISVNRD